MTNFEPQFGFGEQLSITQVDTDLIERNGMVAELTEFQVGVIAAAGLGEEFAVTFGDITAPLGLEDSDASRTSILREVAAMNGAVEPLHLLLEGVGDSGLRLRDSRYRFPGLAHADPQHPIVKAAAHDMPDGILADGDRFISVDADTASEILRPKDMTIAQLFLRSVGHALTIQDLILGAWPERDHEDPAEHKKIRDQMRRIKPLINKSLADIGYVLMHDSAHYTVVQRPH